MELAELKKIALSRARTLGHEFEDTNYGKRSPGKGWRPAGGRKLGIVNKCVRCDAQICIARDTGDTIQDYDESHIWGNALSTRCEEWNE